MRKKKTISSSQSSDTVSPFVNSRATVKIFLEEVDKFQKSKKQADVMLRHIAKEALSKQQFTYSE